jgi:peptidoglycan/xylan/chitin deacetylase (PgdA/CDA1 family)
MLEMFKVILSHDIDRTKKTYQFLTKPLKAIINGDIKLFFSLLSTQFKTGNYWLFDDIIKIETSHNVKSTFFFLNESIKFNILKPGSFYLSLGRYDILRNDIANLIKRLDQEGWEIGMHGSYNSYKDLNLLKHEKKILENIIDHPIYVIRQHYLNLDDQTWKLQELAGFKYDSSFGSTTHIGFVDRRYRPFHPNQSEFIVFPQVIMDTCFMSDNHRWAKLEEIIDICYKENAVLVVNFHNHVFNEKEFPGFRSAYIRIIERCLDRDGKFITFNESAKYYHSTDTSQR